MWLSPMLIVYVTTEALTVVDGFKVALFDKFTSLKIALCIIIHVPKRLYICSYFFDLSAVPLSYLS